MALVQHLYYCSRLLLVRLGVFPPPSLYSFLPQRALHTCSEFHAPMPRSLASGSYSHTLAPSNLS